MRRSRLRRYGHFDGLGKELYIQCQWTASVGRPRKTWQDIVFAYSSLVGINPRYRQGRVSCKKATGEKNKEHGKTAVKRRVRW